MGLASEDFLASAKDIVNKDKKDIFLQKTGASVNGAVTGLIFGLMIGYYKDKNLYISALIGAVIGGVASSILIDTKTKKNEK
jgi:uncharacterized membrane protein YeaQ/YmgE (transglycosylase-associated protein family)